MRNLSDNRRLLHFFRFAAVVILSVPLYRYLDDIISAWFIIAVLLSAVLGGYAAYRLKLRLIPAGVMLAVTALLIRYLVVLISGGLSSLIQSTFLDFSAFRFDSGFFPLFPLFLYTAFCWYMVLRKPGFAAAELLINAVIYGLLLWSQGGYGITIFPHPGMLAALSIVFFIAELFVLLLSFQAAENRTRLGFLAVVLPLFLALVFLMFGRYSEGASKDGGGLMQPTLFRFDFSDYVKLETEISMDNDLVMLFRNYGYLNSVYLRRFYLSGYRPDRGFFSTGRAG